MKRFFKIFFCLVLMHPMTYSSDLTWNAFLGGSSSNAGQAVVVDGTGNSYVCGHSNASWGAAPVHPFIGSVDAYVAKLDPFGNLVWNTFIGGTGSDQAMCLAIDATGNLYIGGTSTGFWGSPVNGLSGGADAFVAKLDIDGNMVWNTFLGGSQDDACSGIAIDGSGNLFVCGSSNGEWGSPVTAYTGSSDGHLAKLSNSGILQWNTFMGSAATSETCNGVVLDGSGNAYVGGSGGSWGTPIHPPSSARDGFIGKFSTDGVRTWNTFFGGSSNDYVGGIAIDGSGNIHVGGQSLSSWGSPVRSYTGSGDMYAAKFSSDGTLTWNTFMGISSNESSNAIAVDGSGNLFIAGHGQGPWGTPVRAYTSSSDALVVKISASGELGWNTFIGGGGSDNALSLAVDHSGKIYVSGQSDATWENPVCAFTDGIDSFVARLTGSGILDVAASPTPVELIAFTATPLHSSAALTWKTATETQNYGFEIERRMLHPNPSVDASDILRAASAWSTIGFVAGNGYSNAPHFYSYTDKIAVAGTYAYRLKQIDNNGAHAYSAESEVIVDVPGVYTLNQNFPNPFNPATAITFSLALDGFTSLKIYDMMGREVATLVGGERKAGVMYTSVFDASTLTNGVYIARLIAGAYSKSVKMSLVK